MCFETVQSPTRSLASSNRSTTTVAPAKKASRRIDPNELAHQVAQYVNAKGDLVSQSGDSSNPFSGASMVKTLKKGSLRVTFEASRPEGGILNGADAAGTAHVVVKQGRKVLLEANGDSTLKFTDTKYTPGSWTKPFRAFDTSEMDNL